MMVDGFKNQESMPCLFRRSKRLSSRVREVAARPTPGATAAKTAKRPWPSKPRPSVPCSASLAPASHPDALARPFFHSHADRIAELLAICVSLGRPYAIAATDSAEEPLFSKL
jgi:hypothetical protein